MTITEIVHQLMDKDHPGWRDRILPDEYDDAFRDPLKINQSERQIEELKAFEKWLVQGQEVKREG